MVIALIMLCLNIVTFGVENQIISVSPNSAEAGQIKLMVTFKLDTDMPPAPPTGIIPESMSIGDVNGTSITHSSQYEITALFDIPADESSGTKDVSISFITPHGDLTFSIANGFTINESNSPDIPTESQCEGYNLFTPLNSTETYLMDCNGQLVHTWSSNYKPGLSVYFLEDGTLLRTSNTQDISFNVPSVL